MDTELLHFKIGLSGTSSIKQPKILIKVNDQQFIDVVLTKNPNETEYFEFSATLDEGNHCLEIVLQNKTDQDTIMNHDGEILSDMILNIDSVEIDDIDLGPLLWTSSVYKPEYPISYVQHCESIGQNLLPELQNCVNLGWNGRWSLPFTSPFYIWLLENI